MAVPRQTLKAARAIVPGALGEDERSAAARVAEIQRSRLLAGTVVAVNELGFEAATVAQVAARARVSRRTFYELFANREQCLVALLDNTAAELERELGTAGVAELAWRERMRVGLWVILHFLERERALARVCVVEAARGGEVVQRRREAVLGRLAQALDQGRSQGGRAAELSLLTAEGLVGAAFAIVYARLAREDCRPLRDVYGELLGILLLPYVGPAAARREQGRPLPELSVAARDSRADSLAGDPLAGLPIRMTYRTARVLLGVSERPGASNRELAEWAGISDQGQVSKLLARLERHGLLVNSGEGRPRGERNAWSLTDRGQRVAWGLQLGADWQRSA